jgi:hypothetical protein
VIDVYLGNHTILSTGEYASSGYGVVIGRILAAFTLVIWPMFARQLGRS